MATKVVKATKVTFEGIGKSKLFRFRCENGFFFAVQSYNRGVLEILPSYGTHIDDLAEAIAGCFVEGSNFYGVKQIDFEFDGIEYSITSENANADDIIAAWERIII